MTHDKKAQIKQARPQEQMCAATFFSEKGKSQAYGQVKNNEEQDEVEIPAPPDKAE